MSGADSASDFVPGYIIQPDKFAKPFDYSILIPASTIPTTPAKKAIRNGNP
jgi:hypothetical protein